MRRLVLVVFFGLALAVPAVMAQDAAKVDPKHYKVEIDNSQVRVLRVKYGPREKSVMHSHPFGVVVYLTDAHIRFHLPGGKSEVRNGKAQRHHALMDFEARQRMHHDGAGIA